MPWRVGDLESGTIVKQHDRSGEVSRASTSTASLSVNQHVPTVDHGVAKVKNIRSYKTALADSYSFTCRLATR